MSQTAGHNGQDTDQRRSAPARLLLAPFRFFMKLLVILGFIAFGLFVGGFLKYSSSITNLDAPANIDPTDAIVVLTGGSSRISRALELVKAGKGKRLLISGVNPGTQAADISKVNHSHQALFDCCVDLESKALNTTGNAVESSKWAQAKGYQSLIVVTSAYHMPRSLLEFRRAMPDLKLFAYPVPLAELQKDGWWTRPELLRLVMSEYVKYVGAHLRGFFTPTEWSALRATLSGG